MKFGSLFSGIGGFDLGLERAGMECAWQVEIDEYCLKVLEKHWPDVRRYKDVKEVGEHNLEPVDLICGGFPCQDISYAGQRKGIESGTRSNLWFEFFRIISELRPRYIIMENVAAILNGGLSIVSRDLATIRYSIEWQTFPASALGAPHGRDRWYAIAYPDSQFCNSILGDLREIIPGYKKSQEWETYRIKRGLGFGEISPLEWWTKISGISKSPLCRVDDGFPHGLDRLRALGNAVVPQVAEFIGRRIMGCMV